MFADDIVTVVRGSRNIKKSMNCVEEWSKENGIPINKNKCGVLVIGKKKEG